VKNKTNYNSNPFTLTFSALSRFFNTNAGWAIALIILGVFGFIGNGLNSVGNLAKERNTSDVGNLWVNTHSVSPEVSTIVALVIVGSVLFFFILIIALVVQTFFSGMFTYAALQSEAGKSVSFSEAFNATTKRFWRLLVSQFLANLKIFGWTLLFIVPGIIAGFRYQLLPYLIMSEPEDEKGISSSHEKTKKLVKGRLWELFGISFVAAIIPIVGTILGLTGKAAHYNQLTATAHAPEKRPDIHWLNYFGLLIGLFMILIIGFGAVLLSIFIANNS
jgi:hypothetical protein